jgi:hypothetical protein
MARRDYGFSALTQNWEGKLIAVIVSGYDGDGAEALCGIKEVGGITIAQRLDTARQPDMPESAIQSGCIDLCFHPRISRRKLCESRMGIQGGVKGPPSRSTRGPVGLGRRSQSQKPSQLRVFLGPFDLDSQPTRVSRTARWGRGEF